ncbi:MAG TPA: DUF4386 family protein [Steroidobacteraceae bacterium]|nr:DUF4386 family protein [Steroidobacteraceae bacterium]
MNTGHGMILLGGVCFIVGAIAFVAVFSYLAAKFDYPRVLDGDAAEVLPRLRNGGAAMRVVWAIYAFLPLLLVPGALAATLALPSSTGSMTLALIFACLGSLAMCLGLMRWPSVHWALAGAYAESADEGRRSISATFKGLNLYLGNYIGEFLGEICLGGFFLLSGFALLDETRFPGWVGRCGIVFGVLFILGAFRNVTPRVQWISSLNNVLLPLWMIVLGGALIALDP